MFFLKEKGKGRAYGGQAKDKRVKAKSRE
jgi:hypothetical protein